MTKFNRENVVQDIADSYALKIEKEIKSISA